MPRLEDSPKGDTVPPQCEVSAKRKDVLGIESDDDDGDELVHVASNIIETDDDKMEVREETVNARTETSIALPLNDKEGVSFKRSLSCFLPDGEQVEDTAPKFDAPPPKRQRRSDRTSSITPRRSSRISVNIPSKPEPVTSAPTNRSRGCPPKKRGPGRPNKRRGPGRPSTKQSPGRPPTKRGPGRPPTKRGPGRPPTKGSPGRPPTKRGPGRPPKTKNSKPCTKQQEWEVEKIVDYRIDALTHEHFYRVKWKGFTNNDNTWEPKKNLVHCNKSIQDFEKALKKKH